MSPSVMDCVAVLPVTFPEVDDEVAGVAGAGGTVVVPFGERFMKFVQGLALLPGVENFRGPSGGLLSDAADDALVGRRIVGEEHGCAGANTHMAGRCISSCRSARCGFWPGRAMVGQTAMHPPHWSHTRMAAVPTVSPDPERSENPPSPRLRTGARTPPTARTGPGTS